jgi:hypothetical protein
MPMGHVIPLRLPEALIQRDDAVATAARQETELRLVGRFSRAMILCLAILHGLNALQRLRRGDEIT